MKEEGLTMDWKKFREERPKMIEDLVHYVISKPDAQSAEDFPNYSIEEWIRDFFKENLEKYELILKGKK